MITYKDFPKPLFRNEQKQMIFFVKKRTLKFLLAVLISLSFNSINAQCFEIESILVDACGSPEGENEMVRLKIGNSPLNSADITADWPSNPWQGICQDASTASTVAALNSTIISCGLLLEPTAGVLPAGASVLIITSTDIDVTANSFTNLTDTLYVLFQCAGNTLGHFANYNTTPGLRSLIVSFSSPVNCNDTVTYDRTLLVNQNGTTGGSTALKNGALANFNPAGNVSYDNQGCQAPFNPNSITADSIQSSSLTICPGDSINIFATTEGGIQSIFWSGNMGSFSNSTGDTTTYFSSLNDPVYFEIIVGGISSCNDTIYDTVNVNVVNTINVFINGNDTIDLCQGQNVTLIANGASNYMWSSGSPSPSINVNSGGFFTVTGSNTCFSESDSVFINLIQPINIVISESSPINICQGDSATLHASGGNIYLWNTAAITDSITINSAGQYYVTDTTNVCFNDTAFIQVNTTPLTNVSITENSPINLCVGDSVLLHANGGSSYLWNSTEITDSITINSAGQYYVTDTASACSSDTAFIQVNTTPLLNVTITERGPITLCDGQSITLHANGANSYLWNTSANTDSITVNSAGTYFVSGNETCPSDTDSVFVSIVLPLNLTINEGNSAVLCSGNNLTIHTSGNGSNYLWINGSAFDSLTVNTIGQYWVTASNGVCPTISDTINIINDINPSALITGDTNLCIGSSNVLKANGVGNFSWSTGLVGSTLTVSSAQQITLTATNNCGTFVTDDITITEEDCSINTEIIIPNIFTPNNDDENDFFKVEGINISSINGQIYNRWGQLLFEWNDINSGWDGENAIEGTYFYIIKVSFVNDDTKVFKGTVLLLK